MVNLDNEIAVLAACFLDDDALLKASSTLQERDFYREQHRIIWRAMQTLTATGDPVDILSVTNLLRDKRDLTRAGGSSYISSLLDQLPDVSNVEHYALEVKKESQSRDLVRIGRILMDDSTPPSSRMETGFGLLSDLSNASVKSREVLVGDVAREIVNRVQGGIDAADGIRMGYVGLDDPLGGLSPGDYIILAARPSIGKSAFALQVAGNVAKDNHPVLYISPEMTDLSLTQRLLASESSVSYKKLSKPSTMSENDKRLVTDAYARIKTLPLVIDESPDQTLEEVALKARRMKSKSGLGLIIVDYLQLLCPGDDTKEEITRISKGLKTIAKNLEIPMLAVSQLSRTMTYQNRKRPELTDLRGSGQLEQDADSVLFLWHPTKAKDKIEVFIEKNRNGPLGAVSFNFNSDTTRFEVGAW